MTNGVMTNGVMTNAVMTNATTPGYNVSVILFVVKPFPAASKRQHARADSCNGINLTDPTENYRL